MSDASGLLYSRSRAPGCVDGRVSGRKPLAVLLCNPCFLLSLTYIAVVRISNPQDVTTWDTMKAVKKTLLQSLDAFPACVQMVGIKFMQRMVQAQTAAVIEDKVVGSKQHRFRRSRPSNEAT